jgi:hypothetical protein
MSTRVDRTVAYYWATLAVGLLGGVAVGVGALVGGHPVVGLVAFTIMTLLTAALVLLAKRSETIRGLLDRRDERISSIDLRATAASGGVTIVAIVVGAVVELAHGHDGSPFTWLGAIAGLSYLAALLVLRARG